MSVIPQTILFTVFIVRLSHGGRIMALTSTDSEDEYCLSEEFKATCLKNEVVLINKATFGRMKVGRCLRNEDEEMLAQNKNNPKFFGCSVDVKHLMNEKCFGKDQCAVRVINDIDQKITKTCYEGLQNYLQATYSCVTVVEPDRSCTVSVTSSAQHLMTSHSTSTKLSCGSRHQPWKLEAPIGQQINISLLDFGGAVNQLGRDCLQYGYIIDREANKNISICAASQTIERYNIIYQSKSSEIQIFFTDEATVDSQAPFKILLRLEAVGCSDVISPEDIWLRRRNQEAVVGCYSSRETWYLKCVNNQWLGVIGNCTRVSPEKAVEVSEKQFESSNHAVLVAVTIAVVGVIICATIIVCGVVCLKRYTSMMALESSKHSLKKPVGKVWHPDFAHQNLVECRSPAA